MAETLESFQIRLILALLILGAICATSNGQDTSHDPARALNAPDDALRVKAQELANLGWRMRTSGRDRNWRHVPVYVDNAINDCADKSLDIERTSILSLSDQFLIKLETKTTPSTKPNTFWLNMDIAGSQGIDFQIGLSTRNEKTFWIFRNGKPPKRTTIEGVKFKIGSHVAVKVPLSEIRKAYQRADVEFPEDPLARGWIRVMPFTHDGKTETDKGASAACPILDRDEFFEKPIAAVADKSNWFRSIPMPIRERKWFVGQGAFGEWTHQSIYAYDLYVVDSTLEPATKPKSQHNEEYYSWDHDLIAPAKSRVLRATSTTLDNAPFDKTRRGPANSVYLDIGGSAAIELIHCRENSVAVNAGDLIDRGAVVAKVGNSSSFTFAHLHLDLWELPNGNERKPLAFENVRVSLNNATDCPWTRQFSIWVIEEGWFAEPAKGTSKPTGEASNR